MSNVEVLSLYEGFFSGGARIVHTEAVVGMQQNGCEQAVLAINSRTEREGLIQPMAYDPSYKRLRAEGIPVTSLGRSAGKNPDTSPFSAQELDIFSEQVDGVRAILTLKEQPVRLINQRDVSTPAIACLQRSDPEHQGPALNELLTAIDGGRVVACIASAQACKRAYAAAGVPEHIMHVVPNAIDLDRFKPSMARRMHVRGELDIPAEAPVVAYAARYDDMKDVPLFLASAGIYLAAKPNAHVLMCGAGMTPDNPHLARNIVATFRRQPGLLERVRLLGVRNDMHYINAAADVAASTSAYGETYPLSLMEGAACGAIPVATDVGDTRDIVDDGRGLLTSRDPADIAWAWQEAIDNRGTFQKNLAATRHRFGRAAMVAGYQSVINQYQLVA